MRRTGVVGLVLAAFMLCGHAAALGQCITDDECLDANLCNGSETCIGGTCQPGTPLNCDDENLCSSDSCDPATGCVHVPRTGNIACDDLNACTTSDLCTDGVCVGSVPPECNDNKICTTDTCDPVAGCVYTPNSASCSDGNACNGEEVCSGGSCQPGAPLVCNDNNPCTDDSCDPTTGCFSTNDDTNSCDDGNVCNGQEVCAAGKCPAGSPVVCNDNNPCTDDACDASGGCVFTNNDSNVCTDGDVCNGNETCIAGSCQPGTPLTCNDGNPCTDDSCDAAAGCLYANDDGNSCDDGNVCNGVELCLDGQCQTSQPLVCDDQNPCTDDGCDPSVGCVFTNDDANDCRDADACNGEEVCAGGECRPGSGLDCDDRNPCTDDSCDAASGCLHVNDDSNSCDDGDLCNGPETCAAGVCQAGQALSCNDGNPCTDDSCDAGSGCIYVNDDSNSCGNGNACDGLETCSGGTCQTGAPPACDDSNPCTDDACEPATGCVFVNDDSNSCDDGDACNGVESCVNGACQAGTAPVCNDSNPCTDDSCDAASGCVYVNDDGNSCDDGNVCNGAESCAAGVCQAGAALICNDNKPCTDDTCDPVSGCVYTNDDSNACGDGDPCNGTEACAGGECKPSESPVCDDDNPCTDDSCDSASGCVYVNNDANSCDDGDLCNGAELCAGGACRPGESLVCDDENPCTDDACDPVSGCVHTNDDSNACGDGDACNGAEVCAGGQCQDGEPPACDDANPCTDDVCDAALGCVFMSNDANSCDDGNACNGAEACAAGMCTSGAPLICADNNPCTDDSCDPIAGCVYVNDDTNSCSDGNVCNGGESCSSGACATGTPLVCNDNNPCTDDACDPAAGCVYAHDDSNLCADSNACNGIETCVSGACQAGTPLVCNDNNLCTDDSCNPASGCVFTNDDTNICNDGNVCNGNEGCLAGVCRAGLVPVCNDNNPCTDDSCDPQLGCTSVADDTNSCSNGNVCDGVETCQSGQCRLGTALVCADSNPCTDDSCDPIQGCKFTNDDTNACGDGNACNGADVCIAGVCQTPPPPVCNDNNLCTDDSCDPAVGCVYTNDDSNSCDDGNVCTGAEVCAGGVCQTGTPLVCNDNNPCTDDSCDPVSGCVFANDDSNTCSDGNICTDRDFCSGGVCTGGPPPNCNDNNPCTDDSCDQILGCRNIADDSNSCADADFCDGQETCQGGTCRPGTLPDCNDNNPCTDDLCDASAGCRNVADDSNSCGDGTVCTGIEICLSGTCVAGTPLNCDDQNPCTTDSCDPVAGCVNANNQNPCDDGLFCTQTDACSGGQCVGSGSPCGSLLCDEQNDLCGECLSDGQCDDQNSCTLDACALGECHHTNTTDPCDDGNFCTPDDVCSGGQCIGFGDACPGQTCDQAGRRCVECLTDEHCDDHVFCNGQESCDVVSGVCQSTGPIDCPAQNPQTPHCDESRNACVQCITNSHCSDGLFCTGAETCNAATATCSVPPPVDCAAIDPGKPHCDENIDRCVQCLQVSHCNDANPCTDDACSGGLCTYTHNTLACDDGLFCTTTDVCTKGECVGTGDACPGETCHENLNICGNCSGHADCNDNNMCTNDFCLTFQCQHTNITGLCNDGQFCTATDRCINGFCVGFGERCPEGFCDEQTDACMQCLSDGDCDDGNECTLDACVNDGCSHSPYSGSCDDGDWCTTMDTCDGMDCMGFGERCPGQLCDSMNHVCGECFDHADCDDQNPCTEDYCIDEICFSMSIDGPCEDGLFCTSGDMCANGACLPGTDPCAGLGQCDEAADSCGACLPPVVTAIGSRSLAVHPLSRDAHPVALRVNGAATEPAACVELYVQSHCSDGLDDGNVCGGDEDCRRACEGGLAAGETCITSEECPGGFCRGRCDRGRLGPEPVYLPAAQWGTVLVGDAEITPDSLYWVSLVCDAGATASTPAGAITWRRGDVDGNTLVDAADVGYIMDIMSQRIIDEVAICRGNIADCLLDNGVNALDIAEVGNVMANKPSACPAICP